MALQRKVVIVAMADGSTERYPVTPMVEITFERSYKVGLGTAKSFEGSDGATRLYQLGYEAMRLTVQKQGGVVPGPDDWFSSIQAMDIEQEDIVPFVAGAAGTASPTSPPSPA